MRSLVENTGKVYTFTGVDITDLSGDVFSGATLLQGNNLTCFIFQAVQIGSPDILSGLFQSNGQTLDLLNGVLGPVISQFDCLQLKRLESAFTNNSQMQGITPYCQ